ncbi:MULTISPECIES: hypothetical protein [unclassified Facklamia]|uniref:hypothetical protein n=1 Tax=Aerococcaceae TaxID=186827 RepID=UPI0013BDDFA0|nr:MULTISPECIES: hypothetical protein [unclassified Facklamia]NEW64858.1 hypothetical protein [Facklamia sp. 252]NEW68180.1 hypothetical protein [Facklamia sp. 253]QQD66026.1 hypothetical protein JDW14_02570 [Aerococcaceae bacterium zg-252]
MLKKLVLMSSVLLVRPNAVPVMAQENTAHSVLEAIVNTDMHQYQNFAIESTLTQTEFSGKEEITDWGTQLNYSDNPQFTFQAELVSAGASVELLLKDNALYFSDVFNQWHLVTDNFNEYRESYVPKDSFQSAMPLSEKEIAFIEQFTDFTETEEVFIFSLKEDINAEEFSTAFSQMISERVKQGQSSPALLESLLHDYTSPAAIEGFLSQKPEIQFAFDKNTYLLTAIKVNLQREDGMVDLIMAFLDYGKQFDIQAPPSEEVMLRDDVQE